MTAHSPESPPHHMALHTASTPNRVRLATDQAATDRAASDPAALYALRLLAGSPDPEIGPLALGRLLEGVTPRLTRLASAWARTLPRPHLDANDLVVELQLHLAVVLDQCRATTPHGLLAWVHAVCLGHLRHLARTERRAARREAEAVAVHTDDVLHSAPPTDDTGAPQQSTDVAAHCVAHGGRAPGRAAAPSRGGAVAAGTWPGASRDALTEILAQLPHDARAVLTLRAADGASWATVARALGVTRATARRRHAQAVQAARAVAAADRSAAA